MLETVNDYIDLDLTHSLHTSERKSFKGCRRRWNWLFRGYYYPKTTAKPLEFGVAYHKAMEVLYEPKFWDKPREAVLLMAIQAFRQRCQKQLATYEEYFGTLNPKVSGDEEILKDYEERMIMGEGMLRYHAENMLPEFRENYRPIKVEVSFEVPILDDNGLQLWCKCDNCWLRYKAYMRTQLPNVRFDLHGDGDESDAREGWYGLPVTYGGRIDCVMENIHDHTQWIFDWKTAAQLSVDRDEFLDLDDQISSYVWALWVLGSQCSGFVYVEQKKATGEEPEPLKTMRLGRRFSISKSSIGCSAEVYEKTVSENDPEAHAAGLYDEFIQWLRENNKMHAIYVKHRNATEIEQTGKMISWEAQDMINPDTRIYPNAGRFSCGSCAFRVPCLSVNDGSDYQYSLDTMFEKRRYHYWVDREPSTESKGGE